MTDVFIDINSKQMIKVIKKLGFEFIRQSGSSHAIFRREVDNRRTTVPVHSGKSLKRKTIKSICKDADINLAQLKMLIDK